MTKQDNTQDTTEGALAIALRAAEAKKGKSRGTKAMGTATAAVQQPQQTNDQPERDAEANDRVETQQAQQEVEQAKEISPAPEVTVKSVTKKKKKSGKKKPKAKAATDEDREMTVVEEVDDIMKDLNKKGSVAAAAAKPEKIDFSKITRTIHMPEEQLQRLVYSDKEYAEAIKGVLQRIGVTRLDGRQITDVTTLSREEALRLLIKAEVELRNGRKELAGVFRQNENFHTKIEAMNEQIRGFQKKTMDIEVELTSSKNTIIELMQQRAYEYPAGMPRWIIVRPNMENPDKTLMLGYKGSHPVESMKVLTEKKIDKLFSPRSITRCGAKNPHLKKRILHFFSASDADMFLQWLYKNRHKTELKVVEEWIVYELAVREWKGRDHHSSFVQIGTTSPTKTVPSVEEEDIEVKDDVPESDEPMPDVDADLDDEPGIIDDEPEADENEKVKPKKAVTKSKVKEGLNALLERLRKTTKSRG